MSSSTDYDDPDEPFKEIPEEALPKLLEALRKDFPRSIHAYSYVKTVIDWRKKNASMESHILAPYGDFSDGTFFLYTVMKLTASYNVGTLFFMSEKGGLVLKKALLVTKFPFEENVLFTCVPDHVVPVITDVLNQRCQKPFTSSRDVVHFMNKEDATKLTYSLPFDVEVRNLNLSHAEQINDVWPHKMDGSVSIIKNQISLGFGKGVFRKSDGTLLSWGMLSFYGGLGVVQTLKGEERKGYAKIVINAVALEMARLGMDIHLNVLAKNTASLSLFQKLGFNAIGAGTWFFAYNS